jgi:hypothetical protein
MPAYDPAMDAARVSMEREKTSPTVDPFRIWFEKTKKGLRLKLGWADRVYRVPLSAQ